MTKTRGRTTERQITLGVRVNEVESAALRAIARQEHRNQSEILRELIREEAKRRGVWPSPHQEGENDAAT